MSLLADSIQPLTHWLQANPNWSLLITFLIALSESLAIIGSVVPGSVTMTAIGILAGSGIMRIDLTLIASTLGAICGDSISYAVGYFYSEKLVDVWPFRKYPNWLNYGKDFFARHGGKSVLLGRFVGPLRSITPIIAGIMHMKQWRFLIANIISAIGWSLLYVMPGVLIGTAGHELSAESATRLFIVILLVLSIIWLLGLFIKWTVTKIHSFLKNNLHGFWVSFRNHVWLFKLYTLFTPKDELNHYPTAGLLLLNLLSLFSFTALLILSIESQYIKNIDLPIHLFLQSFHTHLLEAVFIACTQLTSVLTSACLYLSCCFWFLHHKKIRAISYLSFLVISSSLIAYILSHCINYPRPQGSLIVMSGSSFPNNNLLVATALYGFIFYYINNKYSLLTNTLRSFILVVLGLSGFGSIYLGDYWFSTVLASYFIGLFNCLIFCLFYRKLHCPKSKKEQSVTILSLLLITILGASAVSTYLNFKQLVYAHTPCHQEYTLDKSVWWHQQKPILPLYRLNRLGRRIGVLNIQYEGDLALLEERLESAGWETHNETLFKKIVMRINSNSNNKIKLPLLAELYENKRPELMMTYYDKQSDVTVELSLWESNYNVHTANNPLWIGTVYSNVHKKNNNKLISSLMYLKPALHQFTLRTIQVPEELIKTTLMPAEPCILLIKSQEE